MNTLARLALTLMLALAASATMAQGFPPNCADTGGQHLNYSTATHTWACGTSVPAGTGDITAVGDVTSGAAFDGTQGTTLTSTAAGMTITATQGAAVSVGGSVTITGGPGGATSGAGGAVTIQSGTATNGNGGQSSLIGGTGGGVGGNGAAAVLQGGGATDGNGGNAVVTGNNGTGTNRNGGLVALSAGNNTGTGVKGSILLRVNGTVTAATISGPEGGHLVFSAVAAPVIGACGTTPSVAGNDNAMFVTVGTGGVATSCAVTFGTAWTTAPVCIAQNTVDRVAYEMDTTTTTLTITAAAAITASSNFHVICMGR